MTKVSRQWCKWRTFAKRPFFVSEFQEISWKCFFVLGQSCHFPRSFLQSAHFFSAASERMASFSWAHEATSATVRVVVAPLPVYTKSREFQYVFYRISNAKRSKNDEIELFLISTWDTCTVEFRRVREHCPPPSPFSKQVLLFSWLLPSCWWRRFVDLNS
jgi:hypothetical protein